MDPASPAGTSAVASMRPIWLLDVDGVINVAARVPGVPVWPAEAWIRTQARAGRRSYPILAAQPVLAFIRDVATSGAADVRWHTTWQHDAVTHLAPALGLPALPVENAPEFASANGASGYAGTFTGHTWWKLPAARRRVAAGQVLLWTDDDLALDSVQRAIGVEPLPADTTLLIAPQTHVGLTPDHLAAIASFLERWP